MSIGDGLMPEIKNSVKTVNSRGCFAAGLLAVLCIFPGSAFAYIGPGLGSGALAAVLGILAGLMMLFVGVVWYPIKRFVRHLRSKR